MVSRMAKPEEVLVVENEQGEVVREFMKDTDAINNYKNMRETLGMINPLSANHAEWSNTLKIRRQKLTNCLSLFDHFVGLALKGLTF